MKSLGCPKQPYVLWEAQGLELQLSAVERLMGFVLGSTALLPPCQTEWGGWSKPEPPCAAHQLAFGVHEGPQEDRGTTRSKGQGCS